MKKKWVWYLLVAIVVIVFGILLFLYFNTMKAGKNIDVPFVSQKKEINAEELSSILEESQKNLPKPTQEDLNKIQNLLESKPATTTPKKDSANSINDALNQSAAEERAKIQNLLQ